jgi:DNA processing protein
MDVNTLTVKNGGIPARLHNIPSPPKELFHRGEDLKVLLQRPCVAIVGSRGVTAYGQQVTQHFAGKLAEQGIVVISGLALGVDTIAHRAALAVNGRTISVLPSSVQAPYPAGNRQLAEKILTGGGALVSEYAEGATNFKTNFVARNRLVTGLADALLITEATADSGSLHTAKFARLQDKPVFAVPGNITSRASVGTNSLIKAGAAAATSYKDVLQALGLQEHRLKAAAVQGANETEQKVLDLLFAGMSDGEALLRESGLEISLFNQTLSMLEITGRVRALGNNQWAIY